MDDHEHATTTPGRPQARQTITPAMRTALQGMGDALVVCLYCQQPAMILRMRVGRALPLCRQHARTDSIDREIAEQRARASAMRPKR